MFRQVTHGSAATRHRAGRALLLGRFRFVRRADGFLSEECAVPVSVGFPAFSQDDPFHPPKRALEFAALQEMAVVAGFAMMQPLIGQKRLENEPASRRERLPEKRKEISL